MRVYCGGREIHQIVHSLVGKTQKHRREEENICLVPLRFQPLLCLRNLECDAEGSGHVFLEYTFFFVKIEYIVLVNVLRI